MMKLILLFALFSGVVYYYDLDIKSIVERSGAPSWLEARGYTIKHHTASAGSQGELGTTTAK